MQGSCRPLIASGAGCIVFRSTEGCSRKIVGVGRSATRNVIGMPLARPPRMPPWRFVAVRTTPPSTVKASLNIEPVRRVHAKPVPNATPFTPGIAKSAADSSDSRPSKSAPPRPAGTPVTVQTMVPPTESPASRARAISSDIFSGSVSPWIVSTRAETAMPRVFRNCRQTPPAAQSGAVRRPEFLPPPVGMRPISIHCPKSAWPGRGIVRSAP